MNRFLMSTALVAATAVGAAAQTAMPEASHRSAPISAVSAFLASDITGSTLYTLPTDEARALRPDSMTGMTPTQPPSSGSSVFLSEREAWESVGAINDLVIAEDGGVRGVLLDVGGFLGFGARTVMIDIDEIFFVTEVGEATDLSVLIAKTAEELEALPEFDDTMLHAGLTAGDQAASPVRGIALGATDGAQATMASATEALGDVFGPEHTMLDGAERTGERLMAADVYDAAGDSVGSVNDIIFAPDGSVDAIIVDIGGFLGFGAHSVMLPLDEAQIGWSESDGDVRVQFAMTAEQLEAMPEHVN